MAEEIKRKSIFNFLPTEPYSIDTAENNITARQAYRVAEQENKPIGVWSQQSNPQPRIKEGSQIISRDDEEKIRMQNLKQRGQIVKESRQERQMERSEHQEFGTRPRFERWRSESKSAAPLRLGEKVGATFLRLGQLRSVPSIKSLPLSGTRKYGKEIEAKKAQYSFRKNYKSSNGERVE